MFANWSCHQGTRLPAAGLGIILAVAILLPALAHAERIDLGGAPLAVNLVESNGERSVIEITLGQFDAEAVEINGQTWYTIAAEGAIVQQVAGMPALPDVRRSLIIPDDRAMTAQLLASSFVDLPAMPVAPSKGHLPRTIDPQTVPYSFDAFYSGNGTYPEAVISGDTPYILRDYRGMVLDVNPFQYLPATQTLRVFTRLLVEVKPAGPGTINVLERTADLTHVDPQFAMLYANHFLNYGAGQRYVPIPEEGGLLIITYDDFLPDVQPLYEWKIQKGLPTSLVTLSEVGTTATAIRDYIQNAYETWNLAYVLLIGDALQVPTFSHAGGGSDPSYGLLVGSDYYPEIFVGRFSAENPAQVQTQVERTIAYERDTGAGLIWPQYGTGIASNQGPGHHGEYDDEHEDLIREDLLAYGYLGVDQIYDPYATATMVADALNEGRGIVNYTGHGSTTSWGSSGFSNTHVNALVNHHMLPFISSVACVNGNFTGTTCFAEAWLRATDGELPTGAIATYMSSINQSWNPPMDAQDESVDLLVADANRTIGGLWFNGSCFMMDVNPGSAGYDMAMTWIIFGDPSLAVRTKAPELMTVNHPGTLILGQSEYEVQVPGVEGALCALSAAGVLYGAALTDAGGTAVIVCDPAPPEPMNLTLTITAYNKVTYVGDVEVIPAAGPYLLIGDVEYYDGGGDGLVNAGEAVEMRVLLRNVGIEPAVNISATLGEDDEYIELTEAYQTFPDIPAGGEAWCTGLYGFDVAPDCPDQHPVTLPLTITGDERPVWEANISFLVHAPEITIYAIEIDDTVGGDGNLRLDPGETATVAISLHNGGSGRLDDIVGRFTCSHPLVTILAGEGGIAGLGEDEIGLLEPVFEVAVDAGFPAFAADFELDLTGSNSFAQAFPLSLPIGGFYETVENGSPGWSHYVVSGGSFVDQWHISTQRNHTPGGGHSWKCGDVGAADYANLLDAGLETPTVNLAGEGELVFWMWIDAEASGAYPDRAYDGGLVEISVAGGPFEQITPLGGYTHTIRPGSIPGPFPEDTPVFSGSADWQEVRFDLADITGDVSFRFRFGSDGADTREGWFIDDIEILGLGTPTAVSPGAAGLRLGLAAARPNPFSGTTRITFALPQAARAAVDIFDASGRLIRTLVQGSLPAGEHRLTWDGGDAAGRPMASGLYYCRLSTQNGALQRSLVLLR